jgi:pimeloyl-ACP methyl ester carboxylesterase
VAQEVVRSTLPVRGLPVAYSSWGLTPGAPEIVLCFHGFLDHGDSFAPVAEVLAQRLPVVALDFRGFGRSGWIGDGGYYHFMDYVADVERLHTHLGSPAVHLLAHSMGGSVATTFTSVRSEAVRSLVMLEGMGPPREDLVGRAGAAAPLGRRAGRGARERRRGRAPHDPQAHARRGGRGPALVPHQPAPEP